MGKQGVRPAPASGRVGSHRVRPGHTSHHPTHPALRPPEGREHTFPPRSGTSLQSPGAGTQVSGAARQPLQHPRRGASRPHPLHTPRPRGQKGLVSDPHAYRWECKKTLPGSRSFSPSVVSNSVTPWTAAGQAPLSISNSQSSTQTHVLCVGDAIQPSDPLSAPSPPIFSLSQHRPFPMSQFFPLGDPSIGASASSSVLPMIFRTDFL